ncbi:MAG: prolipoprotein diacylglyceryl transferase [Crocinitomicaceae bacterium]
MDLSIVWNVGPEVIPGFDRPNKYALFFIGGIILGYYLIKRIYAKEKVDIKELDNLLMWVVVSTIVGARLGHVFFYDWAYYKENLGEIIAVWKGGLASHGAAIGIILGVLLYKRFSSKMPVLWTLDRAVIAIAIAGCFIRVGNLMNSEIKGKPSDRAMSIVFMKNYEKKLHGYFPDFELTYKATGEDSTVNGIAYPEYEITVKLPEKNNQAITQYIVNESNNGRSDTYEILAMNNSKLSEDLIQEDQFTIYMYLIPRMPTQIYEAIGYLVIFLGLFFLYWKTNAGRIQGFIFGAFLIGIFGFRFFIEFLKEGQAERDAETMINTGQMLSIPFVLIGLFFVLRKIKELKKGYPEEG